MSSGSTSAGGGGGGRGGDRASDPSSASSSRGRPTVAEAVWPQHFVEAVAVRVAVDAAQTRGRLAAAPAIAAVFQVCSTWRCVSESELLWEEITRRVWSRCRCLLASWQDEFRRLHRTGLNFRSHHCTHTHVLPPPYGYLISCRRLALSDSHLAAGFSDGTVRLFHLPSGRHLASFGPDPQQGRLGLYSLSVSGLVILSSDGEHQQQQQQQRLVIAFQNGDVNIASPEEPPAGVRRVNVGTPVEDGPMVDFTGSSNSRWWVGLFAGVPGRSWHVWDGETEQLVYVGGSLTDLDSVMGWRMLTDLRGPAIGRVRMPEPGIAVGCTASRIQVIALDGGGGSDGDGEVGDTGSVVRYVEVRRGGVVVEAVDGCDGRVMVVDQVRRIAKVRTARTLGEVCRFSTAAARRRRRREEEEGEGGAVGCMNWGYAVLVCSSGEPAGGGAIRVWDALSGEYLYRLREGTGGVNAGTASVIAASDRYVSAWSEDTGLHAWDFGVDGAVP